MEDRDVLSGLPPEERAQIAAMLAERGEDPEDEVFVTEEPMGVVRGFVRLAERLLGFAALTEVGWYLYALAGLKTPFGGIHAPVALTIGSGLAGVLLLFWSDGRWRRTFSLLLGIAALALCLVSMRWVDASPQGVGEYWAGWERSRTRLSGDLCYRIDSATFQLRGANPAARFVYARGVWPSAFGEAEFKRYFFSDLRMARRADGWTCIAR